MSNTLSRRDPNGGNGGRIGIVVLDRHPVPADPRLRAFVWCPRTRSSLPRSENARQSPLRMMVGQATLTVLDEGE